MKRKIIPDIPEIDYYGNEVDYIFNLLEAIFVDAIDMGYPVLTRYMHNHKHNIIVGYEDDGNKIISKDAIETTAIHTTSETVVREIWEDVVAEYILLKEKNEPAPERERVLNLFKLIVNRARRTDKINGKKVGFTAWESYLYDLEFDDFTDIALLEKDAPTVDGIAHSVQHRFFIYCDGLCQIDARNSALPYYRSLAEKFPDWR